MKRNSSQWGTKQWFAENLRDGHDQAGSYYAHKVNGYQINRHAEIISAIEEVVPKSQGLAILDVGCALGDLGGRAAELFPLPMLVGIDFVLHAVVEAKRSQPEYTFLVGALPELPLKNSLFDLVLCSEVFYYLRGPERTKALADVTRVMKPGGVMVFSSHLDDGTKYFSRESALEFVGATMEVKTVKIACNGLYHRLYRRLLQIINLCEGLKKKHEEFDGRHQLFRVVKRCSRLPVIGHLVSLFVCLMAFVAQGVLRSRQLPRVLGIASTVFVGKPTNLIVVATKRSVKAKS